MNERTQTHILPAAAVGAGILGLLLEVWLLYFSRDDRGLIIPHHPASLLLWVLTLGVIAALFLLTRKVHPRVRSYVRTFPASRMGFAGAVAAAAGIVALVLPELLSSPDTLTLICDILGLAAAAALAYTGFARLRGFRPHPVFHSAVCLFFALWAVCHYRLWSGDPQLSDYCFPLFSNLALMLTAYHRAAFDVLTGNRRTYRFFRLLTLYLCIAAIAAGGVAYGGFALWMLASPAHADMEDA